MICQKMVSFCTTSHDPVNSLLYIGVSWYVLSDLLRSFVQLVSIRTCGSSVAKQLRECIRIHSWQYNWKANCEFGYLVCLGALQDVHPVILKHLRMSAAQNFRPVRLLAMSKYCWIKDLTQISNTIPRYIYNKYIDDLQPLKWSVSIAMLVYQRVAEKWDVSQTSKHPKVSCQLQVLCSFQRGVAMLGWTSDAIC